MGGRQSTTKDRFDMVVENMTKSVNETVKGCAINSKIGQNIDIKMDCLIASVDNVFQDSKWKTIVNCVTDSRQDNRVQSKMATAFDQSVTSKQSGISGAVWSSNDLDSATNIRQKMVSNVHQSLKEQAQAQINSIQNERINLRGLRCEAKNISQKIGIDALVKGVLNSSQVSSLRSDFESHVKKTTTNSQEGVNLTLILIFLGAFLVIAFALKLKFKK